MWETEDHNWGAGWVQVSVVDLNTPDFTQNPPKQTARLHIHMHLSDDNGDDSWFGAAGYTLLFLGKFDGLLVRSERISPTGERPGQP